MGLSNSKSNAPPSSSSLLSGAVVRRSRSSRITVLKSSCLQSHHSENDDPQVSDCPVEETINRVSSSSENRSGSYHFPSKCYRTSKTEQSDDPNCTTSDKELNEWGESSFTATVSRESNNSSRALSSRSLPSRFLSRFSFYPGNLSFRLTRSNSLSSTRANPGTSTSYATSNDEERTVNSATLENRNDRPQGCDIFPACFSNKSLRTRHRHFASNNLQPSSSISDFCDNFQDNQQISSDHDVSRSRNDAGVDFTTDLFSPINHIDSDGAGNRRGVRRLAAREFAERNVRFSRTLSVGRLRDRVLRRATVSDLDMYRFQQDEEVRQTGHFPGRQGSDLATLEATSVNNNLSQTSSYNNYPSSTSAPYYGSPVPVRETPRPRETRYRDLLEHRSNFIERRRRIRSQVRALQRLGSRFQNLSVRERSCILSGQHRAGHCTCRSASRDVNTTDDATDRASISRIVMLAEALFEVLDEIHQQSVVMSSRPSVSSIGSVPAPNRVVDSLPLKIFSKTKKNPSEEAAQCYICLVEYEEGDNMRVLPCHHQFHRACVDKWLKEIHRVCPLCRGDICRPEPSTEGG